MARSSTPGGARKRPSGATHSPSRRTSSSTPTKKKQSIGGNSAAYLKAAEASGVDLSYWWPAPAADELEKSSKYYRRCTRPVGEFMGNWGCFFWTMYIPLQIYYFYGIVVLNKGNLMVPDSEFWYALLFELPDGISIQPTWYCWKMIAVWCLLQFVMEAFLPCFFPFGQGYIEGVTLKNGRRLKYPMNGLTAFFLTHLIYFSACYYEVPLLGLKIEADFVWKHMGSLMTCAVLTSHFFALWLYVSWGVLWRRHVDEPSFEEDYGVFDFRNFWNDYFMGVARNPRICHGSLWKKILPYAEDGFDLKRWWDGRTLTLWILLNWSYLAAQYYGCTLDRDTYEVTATCDATGDWNRIGPASWFIALTHAYYIFDYNWCEPAYLTTTDIRHDLFGFMLTYGMFGFLAMFYPVSFLGHLSGQGKGNEITENYFFTTIGILMYLFGMFMFRWCNIEKHRFRTKVADLKAEYYEAVPNDGGKSTLAGEAEYIAAGLRDYCIFGYNKPGDLKYLRTKEGSYLLFSGTWGYAKHFNYIGDLTMCVGWMIMCYSATHAWPVAPFGYVAYFWVMDIHRCGRDQERCAEKYGKDWDEYCKVAKWNILPGVY
ncbi:unnamed protein product [Amoebophrya sp. A25]|nr:unnamed protein product [Amoebophrya sp. A25]|eukprot:GSA25T00014456001.1